LYGLFPGSTDAWPNPSIGDDNKAENMISPKITFFMVFKELEID
jgi:hypothetical protein